MNPFEEVKALYTGNKIDLQSPYMVNRILSFLPDTFIISQEVNNYLSKLPAWAVQAIYKACIKPHHSTPYIPYQKVMRYKDVLLTEKIATHLCCSSTHARQTIELLRLQGYKPESFFGLKEGE